MELPVKMIVCKYNTVSSGGVQLVEKPTPTKAMPSRSGLFGTTLFASSGRLLVRVRACGVNPVDAKYIIGDKFPESWMDWSARRVNGHTPGFDFSGEVIKSPSGCGYKVSNNNCMIGGKLMNSNRVMSNCECQLANFKDN